MTEAVKEMEKKETRSRAVAAGAPERAQARRVYTPDVDILERKDGFVLLVDMPGVDRKAVDITIEKNSLTIRSRAEANIVEGSRAPSKEYKRYFTLSEEIDRGRIEAAMKNGVLRLVLPKAEAAKSRKVEIKAG